MRSLSLRFTALAAVVIASCGRPPERLAAVEALPVPQLPAWIESISPTGRADTLAQIRIIFAKPVSALQSLSDGGPRDLLSRISIEPQLRGHFTLLTPRMVGFVAEQALPIGTRVRVTLGAGLHDLAGDVLVHDLAWTFQTPPLDFSALPQVRAADYEPTPGPVSLQPVLRVTANAAVDIASLGEHSALIGANDRIAIRAELETPPTPYPGSNARELFDPSLNAWVYQLRPTRALQRGTTYALQIEPGVAPLYGNLPTARNYQGGVRTYAALAIVPTPRPTPGSMTRFAAGDPVIAFSNPLDPASIPGAVTISPQPTRVRSLVSIPSDGSNSIAIDPYALDPDAAYTVTIAPTVKDAFGQVLGETRRVTLRTSDFAPGAWAPNGSNVFPADASVALNFYATNLPENRYQSASAPLRPLQLLGTPAALSMLPAYRQWPFRALSGARRNVQSVVQLPLRDVLGARYGAIAYGFRTALDRPNEDPWLTGIVQLTNLGVFSQWFPSHGIVLVQHLSDGSPVRGASVSVYRLNESSTVPAQHCASGTTDGNGEVDFYGIDVERCSASAAANTAPNLGVIVTEGADAATVTTWNYSGIYRYDVNGGWAGGAPLPRGTLFSDRQMYQPGERGEITGVAYYAKENTIVADTNATYRVSLIDPSNNTKVLGTYRTDASGIFSVPLALSQNQALGYYTLDAKGPSGNDITGSLRVAEFKPPNFKLSVNLAATSAVAGSKLRADVAAAYLFGAPLQGGTAHAYVTRDVAALAPTGWDDFSFGPQWYWPEQTPSFDTDVLQRDLPLDAHGAASLDVAVPNNLPFPMRYRVDMDTSDVSNLSVADSASFLALPSDAIIGLGSDAVGKAGAPLTVRVIVTDANGKPLTGRAVTLQLQKMTYISATQEVEGGESARQAIKYETVSSATVTSTERPVSATLTYAAAGPYRVLANFAGARGDASASSIAVFAFGAGEADWGISDRNAVAVKLDKKDYAIGETAGALVASPYAHADVYFAVIRHDTIYRTVLRNVSGAIRVAFKVTPAMLPNAAVEAVVVRRKPAVAGDTLSLTGMAAFNVGLADRYLKLGIAPRSASVQPGGSQQIDLRLTDRNGRPEKGEIVTMIVNDAILQLSGYRLPDLVQTVFAAQPISTIFADNRESVTLKTQTPPLEKGFGYGGGYLAGAASTRVRTNFRPLAFYGVLRTDAMGRASAHVTMPDDLTTWRVMAVAIAQDRTHFATADSTFVSTQPLIANPLLPQFARPGDRIDLGVSIANQTATGGALEFVLELTGALAFAQGDPRTQRDTVDAGTGMQAYRFRAVVGTPAPTTVSANANLGGHRDVFQVPFIVSDRRSSESVIESGVASGEAVIPIALSSAGTLQVTLANSVVPQFVTPSERVMSDDALPLADEAASRLTIATALRALQRPYRLKLSFDPNAAIASNLAALASYQRGDGGFGEYTDAKQSDPFATAAAVESLAFARARGTSINGASLANATAFLNRALANPGLFRWCAADALCKARLRFEALWALQMLGPPRTDFLSDIVERAADFDSATQIRLARYLLRAPGWRSRGDAMARSLEQQTYVTGRYAVANVAERWSWLGSLVDAQSQMLQLLIEQRAPAERLDGAVRALLAQRCKCGWPTTHGTASAVTALTAYAATERLGANVATARVGDHAIGTARFHATSSSQTFATPASMLHGDAVHVTSQRGTVHYLIVYTYPVARDAPGELAAFRVVRTLNDPDNAASGKKAMPLATMDLTPLAHVSVAAGRVFDVGVRVIVDHPVDRLVIDDPLPAGFEAVDTSFRTALQTLVPQSNSWQIDTSQIYRDRVVAFASHLEPGVYDLHYLVRSVTPGRFVWPGADAYLQDAPEEFGRSAGTTLSIMQ